MDPRLCETTSCPTNIAVIKYWGKADRKLNTPINSSVSVTLNQDDLRAITTVVASKDFTADRLWLNGEEMDTNDVSKNSHAKRFQTCMTEMRKLVEDRVDSKTGEVLIAKEDWPKYKVHVVSMNTFPTAAGLASSAAGYACLVRALAELFCVKATPSDLSVIARQGSGSACRSLFGGFVRWQKGTPESGWVDSRAVQVSTMEDWPDMSTVILVANDAKKVVLSPRVIPSPPNGSDQDTSSTSGMITSVETSPLLDFRAREVVDGRLAKMEAAYKAKDFQTFGQLAMADSNQFHATCLDTYPPIFYLNDTSRQIIRLVHAFNEYHGEIRAAYTFDAGPNAVIFVLKEYQADLLAFMVRFFPPPSPITQRSKFQRFSNKPTMIEKAMRAELPADLVAVGEKTGRVPKEGDVKMVYCTGVGDGPRRLTEDPNECLIDMTTGLPKPIPKLSDEDDSAGNDETQHSGLIGHLTDIKGRVESIERGLGFQLTRLERLLRPSVPSASTVFFNIVTFTGVYAAFFAGLGAIEFFKKRLK